MTFTLEIDAATCIRCGKCAKVCPSQVIVQQEPGGPVSVPRPADCIRCGHCVAVCPTASVRHGLFPPETVHSADRTLLPSPEALMLLCRTRRSNRAFSRKPVPHEKLLQILEAAHRAPTASNRQQVAFTLVTDPEKLRFVSRFTLDTFTAVARKLENPLLRPLLRRIAPDAYRYLPSFHRMQREYERGNDMILRGATALILIHTPRDNAFGTIDSNLAYQNGSLMAEALGVSQFWTGCVYMALRHGKAERFRRELGIDGIVHAGMALGMPQFLYPNYIDRRPIDLQEE